MKSQKSVQHHLYIMIAIVVGFSTFMMGYSYPPFMEVGFGEGQAVESGAESSSDADLIKQYEDLYKTEDE